MLRKTLMVVYTAFLLGANAALADVAALRDGDMLPIPLSEAVGKTRPVDMHLYHEVAEVFFG